MYSFIFIGRSGCGKGTQAKLLEKTLLDKDIAPILYIETGDEFRSFIKGDSFSERKSREFYENDLRQPDFLAAYMWTKNIIENYTDGSSVIFDGTPRSLPEVRVMESAFLFYNFKKSFVIHLNVSRKWAEERLLSRGRADDKALARIEKRLDWYDSDVAPTVEYFKKSELVNFIEVKGEDQIESIHKKIVSAIALF